MKYREVAKKLKSLGVEEAPRKSKGSHRLWHNPANGRVAPLPDWGAKDIKFGTLRAFLRQLDLDWEKFQQA
jgi:predicted RNA binding protein YcfA (HicA-like mRNA interferase family)